MARKYCINCSKVIETTKGFSWLGFLCFNIIYLIYYASKRKRCPICNDRNFSDVE